MATALPLLLVLCCAGDVPVQPPLQLRYTPLVERRLHYYNVGLQGISLGQKLLGVAMVRIASRTHTHTLNMRWLVPMANLYALLVCAGVMHHP